MFLFCWYDKVDKTFVEGTIRAHKSKRSMCRGYLTEFEQNKKMNPVEFDLCVIGEFDENSGLVTAYKKPEILDPTIVYAKSNVDSQNEESD